MPSLSVWSLRRVLLAGNSCPMYCAMESLLRAVGARIQPAPDPLTEESLCRILHEGRYACVVIPDLVRLCPDDPGARHAALNILLGEAQEAGVPLAIMLCTASTPECAPLISHALGFSHGACGDPLSVLCIGHSGSDMSRICRESLMLGARFLSGETSCTGMFTLGDTMGRLPHTPTRDFAP